MPAAEVNQIWEECKANGVLLGKGGFYGNVSDSWMRGREGFVASLL